VKKIESITKILQHDTTCFQKWQNSLRTKKHIFSFPTDPGEEKWLHKSFDLG